MIQITVKLNDMGVCVRACVCVCVYEREREREGGGGRGRERQTNIHRLIYTDELIGLWMDIWVNRSEQVLLKGCLYTYIANLECVSSYLTIVTNLCNTHMHASTHQQ